MAILEKLYNKQKKEWKIKRDGINIGYYTNKEERNQAIKKHGGIANDN